jgi:hypothetical protein
MALELERGRIDLSEGVRARRPQSLPRLAPRLEALETRCLLSDLAALHAASPTLPHPEVAQVGTQRPDDDFLYPSLTSWKAGTPGAAIGPAHVSYVIVPETSAPHSTIGTAQKLPDLPYFGVIGTLGPDSPPDLFEMNVGASAGGVKLELVAQQPAAAPAVEFSLFDATGRVLGTWSASGQPQSGSSFIGLDLPSQPLSANLYLGISAPSSGGSGPAGSLPTVTYQLWVTRLSDSDRPPASGTGAAATALPTPTSAVVLGPFQGIASAPSGPQTQAAASPSTGNGAGAGLGLALTGGSLPTRAAGPLGGVLAGGVASQASLRRLTVTVSRVGDERLLQPFRGDPAVATGSQVEPAREDDPTALVAIRGPGGFPLLGTGAIGNWRGSPRRAVVAADEIAAVDRASDAPAPDRWEISRGSLSFSLTTASLLTLNVVLSDPVAGFDYLANCLDSDDSDRARAPRAARARRA